MPNPLVVVDLTAGTARIADTTVAVQGQPGGALKLAGRVIRPLSFGERWRLLDDVASSGRSLGATVLARSCARESATEPSADDAVAQILAMHLAGARPERRAHAFEAQLAWLVAEGWKAHDVFHTDADLVDLLTADALGTPAENDWTTILLVPDAATSLTEVLLTLERNLFDRMMSPDVGDAVICGDPHRVAQAEFDSPPASFAHIDRRSLDHPPNVNHPVASSAGGRPSTRALPARKASSASTANHAVAGRADSFVPSVETRTVADDGDTAVVIPDAPRPIRAGWPGHPATNARPDAGRNSAPTARAPQDPSASAMRFPESVLSRAETPAVSQGLRPRNRATPPAGAASTVVHDDPVATRTSPLATPSPAGPDALELADQLAALLDDESDLRGLRR